VSPPLDLDAWRQGLDVYRRTGNVPLIRVESIDALLARLDEAEELAAACERLIPECYPCRGTGQIHIASREGHIIGAESCPTCTPARDALARWRGTA
jgi:hypothetical protein